MADSNIALTTIGVKVSYCVETTAGERPSTAYTQIHSLSSTPDFNATPNTADATTFDNEVYTTKVPLLRELPDALEFGAKFSPAFATEWETLMTAFTTASGSGKGVWFCIDIKGFEKSIYFKGQPIQLGIPAMEANAVIDTNVYIVPVGEPVFADDPQYKVQS